ncbi:hypothetical protein THAOC_16132 [Thalassiosira oceanica]|uniref:Uncharacterized protein n=1 Tax=Thalassiosira oceanica TaxID=159749 RepID=K0SQE5_THAOC|nr:hypothetical protein THAOC_16132 [Thalassiosira oceanica]|eukprot:EJK63226.1 hypothetical protein THAOC_16132 [Thalassiosira oceanica]
MLEIPLSRFNRCPADINAQLRPVGYEPIARVMRRDLITRRASFVGLSTCRVGCAEQRRRLLVDLLPGSCLRSTLRGREQRWRARPYHRDWLDLLRWSLMFAYGHFIHGTASDCPSALDAVATWVSPTYFGIPVSSVSQCLVSSGALEALRPARENCAGPLLFDFSRSSKLPLNHSRRESTSPLQTLKRDRELVREQRNRNALEPHRRRALRSPKRANKSFAMTVLLQRTSSVMGRPFLFWPLCKYHWFVK